MFTTDGNGLHRDRFPSSCGLIATPVYGRPGQKALHRPPNYWTQHQPPNRLSSPPLFLALPYATSVAGWQGFVKGELYGVFVRRIAHVDLWYAHR